MYALLIWNQHFCEIQIIFLSKYKIVYFKLYGLAETILISLLIMFYQFWFNSFPKSRLSHLNTTEYHLNVINDQMQSSNATQVYRMFASYQICEEHNYSYAFIHIIDESISLNQQFIRGHFRNPIFYSQVNFVNQSQIAVVMGV